jgi:hypothetical protein
VRWGASYQANSGRISRSGLFEYGRGHSPRCS